MIGGVVRIDLYTDWKACWGQFVLLGYINKTAAISDRSRCLTILQIEQV